ncbi:MAG TPA: hypothetical protein ENK18_03935 [Deltaproteobacteria bacterium]|nr:hypothetical protein [Deltaproteobacteria bacterium]
MERIEIPSHATYSPVALTDLMVGAPLASRLLLGAVLPGQVVSASVLGLYLGSAAQDWVARSGIRPIDFQEEFGVDVDTLEPMTEEARRWEVRLLGNAMNEDWTPRRIPRLRLAQLVNQHLTAYIARITEQEIVTSSEVRSFTLARWVLPFAGGTYDMVSGDVAIFEDHGVFEPHVIAHEFVHRKGYGKELHAQVLAYLAMRASGDPVLIQAGRAERLSRQLSVLAGGSAARFLEALELACLRPELRGIIGQVCPADDEGRARIRDRISDGMRALYDQRMRLSGQNGLSDYDEGFTNFLWTFTHSEQARQPREHAAI